MRLPPGSQLVFDQVVAIPTGPGAVLKSDPKFNDWLGKANDLRLFVFVDRVTGAGALTVLTETTADEELAWVTRAAVLVGASVLGPPVAFQGSDTVASLGGGILGYRRLSVQMNGEVVGTARIRIWAAGRNGYRIFNRLLLNERLTGTDLLVVPYEACAWIVGADTCAVGIQTDEVTGASPNLALFVDESGNGRSWSNYTATSWGPTSGTLVAGYVGSDVKLLGGFVRFSFQFLSSGNSATVRFWVTGRDVRAG